MGPKNDRTPSRFAVLIVPFAVAVIGSGCKPASQKVSVGPFSVDRYEATNTDGSKLDCYVFAAESSKPARLCGDGSPVPGFAGVLFKAVAPDPSSRFVQSIGAPLDSGYYLLKSLGASSLDTWPLGALPMHEWLGGGKKLLSVETGADHHTKVRLIDPAARADESLDAGPSKADSFLLVRAENDDAIILLERLGGEEMISVKSPLSGADLTVADASEDKTEGNRKLYKKGAMDRTNGGVFKPTVGVTSLFAWVGGQWTFDGSPLGPWTAPPGVH